MTAVEALTRPPASVVGASIPRSGHHFLVSILREYYKDRFSYCGSHRSDQCCHQVPCIHTEGASLVLQKNHDVAFKVPVGLTDVLYLVQHRHPVPQTLSNLELHVGSRREHGKEPSTADRRAFMRWLAARAIYFKFFHDKWIAPDRDNVVVMNYDDLARDPVATVSAFISRYEPVDEPALRAAVEAVRDKRGGSSKSYKPRVIEESPHFDPELFSVFESIILDLCPAYGYSRMLEPVDYKEHKLFKMYRKRSYRARGIAYEGERFQVFTKGMVAPLPRPVESGEKDPEDDGLDLEEE